MTSQKHHHPLKSQTLRPLTSERHSHQLPSWAACTPCMGTGPFRCHTSPFSVTWLGTSHQNSCQSPACPSLLRRASWPGWASSPRWTPWSGPGPEAGQQGWRFHCCPCEEPSPKRSMVGSRFFSWCLTPRRVHRAAGHHQPHGASGAAGPTRPASGFILRAEAPFGV